MKKIDRKLLGEVESSLGASVPPSLKDFTPPIEEPMVNMAASLIRSIAARTARKSK